MRPGIRVSAILLSIALLMACSGRNAGEAPVDRIQRLVQEGDGEGVQAMLTADPALVHTRVFNGWNLMHLAGSTEVIEVLSSAGLDINGMEENSWGAPIHTLQMFGDCEAIKVFIEAGADVNLAGRFTIEIMESPWDEYPEETTISIFNDRSTPLHYAAGGGLMDCIEHLLEAGADLEARAADGRTPLLAAAWFGSVEAVEALLDAGADPHARTVNGWTGLHLCAFKPAMPHAPTSEVRDYRRRKTECARLLLEAMGDEALTWEAAGGHTPLDIAEITGQRDFVLAFE